MKRETRQTQELQLTSATAVDEINRRFKQPNKQLYKLQFAVGFKGLKM